MIGKCPKCDATPNIIVEALDAGEVRSEHCPSCNFCVTIAKPSSALHSILNGRPKWLRASCVRWGKDLLPATTSGRATLDVWPLAVTSKTAVRPTTSKLHVGAVPIMRLPSPHEGLNSGSK